MSAASTALQNKIATAVIDTINKPTVAAQAQAARPIIEAVTDKIVPEIVSATNNEPWYQSRVTWGAIASIALPLLGAFGVSTDVIDADQFAALGLAFGAAAGGILTLYGRWVAKRPIGA